MKNRATLRDRRLKAVATISIAAFAVAVPSVLGVADQLPVFGVEVATAAVVPARTIRVDHVLERIGIFQTGVSNQSAGFAVATVVDV